MTSEPPDATPVVRRLLSVVRGEPTAEQLAALVAVVTARASGPDDPPPETRPLWAVPSLRSPHVPGPGAWRASGLPR